MELHQPLQIENHGRNTEVEINDETNSRHNNNFGVLESELVKEVRVTKVQFT